MSRYTVICHRCGKSTFVDLSKTVSDQRCRACRGFLQGVDVRVGEKKMNLRRKLVRKLLGSADAEPVWADQPTPIVPRRKRWPKFYRWTVAAGLVLLPGAVIWAVIVRLNAVPPAHVETFSQVEPGPPDIRSTTAWRSKATAAAAAAMNATTVDELLPWLFHPEVSDETVRRSYETENKLPLGKTLIEDYLIPPGNNYRENVVCFQFFDADDHIRAFTVVEKPDGMKVDWPSLTGLGEMSLEEYMKTLPPRGVVMRLRARIAHYYNDRFSDSAKWLSLRLSDVTDEHVIYGYVERDSNLGVYFPDILPDPESSRTRPDVPLIVVLKYPPDKAKPDQTLLTALFNTTWYAPGGLQPLIDSARKLDEKPAPPETPAVPEKTPAAPGDPGTTPAPPLPGS